MTDVLLVITFLIYTLVYEAMVWVGGMYVIVELDWSPWWILFLVLLSGSQLKPPAWRELCYASNRSDSDSMDV